jgi:hypothetical protein
MTTTARESQQEVTFKDLIAKHNSPGSGFEAGGLVKCELRVGHCDARI